MSMQFSNTSTRRGMIQKIERLLGFDRGTITGDSDLFADITADINDAVDYIYGAIFAICGWIWQHDDSNHEDYPYATFDIVSGTNNYAFTTDEAGNLILEIQKVMIKDGSNSQFRQLPQTDQQSEDKPDFVNAVSGIPTEFDLLGNGVIFDRVPNYSLAEGGIVYFTREGSYFTTSDTTKKPGFVGTYHEFLPYRVAANYASDHGLDNAAELESKAAVLEAKILDHYGRRNKSVRPRLRIKQESCK